MAAVRIFGIRHHGPGSSRSLLGALEAFEPDAVLIEAPADADAALQFAIHPGLTPPVAMLVYGVDDARTSVFYPQTVFSPEWNAARFALRSGASLRAIDLPVAIHFANNDEERGEGSEDSRDSNQDPFALIAEASGFADGESWWEHMVEERTDPMDLFLAITELMTALRDTVGESMDPWEQKREAHMRLAIRKAESDGFSKIAVVCGAWHVPALMTKTTASTDQALLKGLPKIKTSATWVPYTHERVTFASGYGAGIHSPGYYRHLWDSSIDERVKSWLLKTARLLREEGFDASTASVIEAVRLAEALSAVRDRSTPGLKDLLDATRAVLTNGHEEPLAIISRKLIVGLDLGEVPSEVPTVPLQSDLEATQRRLRLKPEALEKKLELDLRTPNDLARSHLFHRLTILSIPWGQMQRVTGKQGTFHEHWLLRWQPELAMRVIVASRWGSSVEAAASAKAVDLAEKHDTLSALTTLAHDALLAALDPIIPVVMQRLDASAAATTDTKALLQALPSLGRVMRYGDVRQTNSEAVGRVFSSIFVRACIGLPSAAAQLDDDAAQELVLAIDGVQSVIAFVSDADSEQLWFDALGGVACRTDTHRLVSGRATRLLLDSGHIETDEASNSLARACSVGDTPAEIAHWIEGFLAGSGTVLIHHDKLWTLLDNWVKALAEEQFMEVLPLLRRTFSTFSKPERRQLGERVGNPRGQGPSLETNIDEERAIRPLPRLRLMLGMEAK